MIKDKNYNLWAVNIIFLSKSNLSSCRLTVTVNSPHVKITWKWSCHSGLVTPKSIIIIIIFPLIWFRQHFNLASIQYVQQQSATQGSNDTAHTVTQNSSSATTSFGTEMVDCQKQTAPSFANNPTMPGLYLASIHQMAPSKRGSTHLIIALLLICRPRKDERLSWPIVGWPAADGLHT